MADVVSQADGGATVVDLSHGPAAAAAGRGQPATEASAVRSALVARPAQRAPRRGGDPRRAGHGEPGRGRHLPRERRRLPRPRSRPPTAAVAACLDRVPAGAAQARLRPRRVRLLRGPLRRAGGGRRDPVAVDAGAAVGRRPRRPRRHRPRDRRQGRVPGGVAVARSRAADRAGDGRARRPDAVRRRPRRQATRPAAPTSACCSPTPTRWPTASAAAPSAARRRRHERRRPDRGATTSPSGYDGQARAARPDVHRPRRRADRRAGPERRRQVDAVPGACSASSTRWPGRWSSRSASACCRRPSARGSTTRSARSTSP